MNYDRFKSNLYSRDCAKYYLEEYKFRFGLKALLTREGGAKRREGLLQQNMEMTDRASGKLKLDTEVEIDELAL